MLKCTNTNCNHEFEPDAAEDIRVFNAAAGTLAVKCPECHRNVRLNKADSNAVLEADPELKKEIEQMKLEKDTKEFEIENAGCGDFETKFRNALSVLGLNSKKYDQKIQAVLSYMEPKEKTREWLRYYMQLVGFAAQNTGERIVNLTFHDDVEPSGMPPYPGTGGGQYGGYTAQTLPGGQGVILVPPSQQPQNPSGFQPIIIDRGGDRSERVVRESNDEGTIIEELDDEGKVKKRIIKGGARQAASSDKPEDQTLKIITMLKDVGLLQSPQTRTEPQTSRIPDEIHLTLTQLKDAIEIMGSSLRDKPAKSENEDIKRMAETVNKLTDQIQTYEKEKRDNETKSLKDELSQVKGMISNLQDRRSGDAPAAGLSDLQFGAHTQHKNLETVTDSVTHMGDRITHPLTEILKNQQKMNSLLLVRDIEKQDGVPAGTYMKVLMPAASPGEGEVKATVQKWQDKAASVPGGK